MATRPLFVPAKDDGLWIAVKNVDFVWSPGFSKAQKERNRIAMHAAASLAGYTDTLEVSSKSNLPLGLELSAFKLRIPILGYDQIPVECAFQGSKVYKGYGPSDDLYSQDPRTAKREAKARNQDDLAWFQFEGERWPLIPKTLFYDWVYLRALSILPPSTLDQLASFDAFTDIEFNPDKSINCQARSCALAVSLMRAGMFGRAIESSESYKSIIANEEKNSQLRQDRLF